VVANENVRGCFALSKKLILHDLPLDNAKKVLPPASAKCLIFSASPSVHHCIGCFGCWVKTPGKCVLGDRGAEFAALMPQCDEFVILSRIVFGGLSPDIKAVLDRSIGFVLPFFCYINGEMHHVKRYDKSPDLRYVFYGSNISEEEKGTAKRLAAANSLNLGSGRSSVCFFQSACECAEVLR
jgi:multimeric flavodoxin WrbA